MDEDDTFSDGDVDDDLINNLAKQFPGSTSMVSSSIKQGLTRKCSII